MADEQRKEIEYLGKNRKRRWIAGALALILCCSTLISGASTAFAASEGGVGIPGQTVENAETQDTSEETQGTEAKASAEDLTIVQGEAFEIEEDFTGITLQDGEKVTLKSAVNEEGKAFDFNAAGSYLCTYTVTPVKGDTYEITRTITVKPREAETSGSRGNAETSDDSDDGEADPEAEEAIEEMMEEGVFLAVVSTRAASARAAQESVSLNKGEVLYYPSDLGSYLTCRFSVNGKVAYCLQSNKSSPPTADYVASIYESNLNLQKVLYYGYGGPGDLTGTYLSKYDTSVRYILTHLAASYAYAGEEVAFTGCYESGIQKYGVREYINYLFGQDAPPTAAISLSSTNEKAYLEGDVQRTANIKLTGDYRNYVNLTLPENVTYHKVGGDTQTGGTVKIYGGTTFYFSAPKTVTGTWKSGTLKGQIGTQWKTLVVSAGSGSQDIGYGEFYEESSSSVSFSVKWMDIATVKVIKADSETKVNLAGAVFGIYSDAACTQLIAKMPATDASGASSVEIIKTQDTVYLKEISVPTGYKLNTAAFNVSLTAGKTTTVSVTNDEQMGKILITKSGEVLTGVSGEAGNLSFTYSNSAFAGAEYKIYAAADIVGQDKKTKIYNAGELVQELKTGKDGSILSGELHLGKYKIVEQKAPDSLTIGKTEEERTQIVTLSYAGQTVELAEGTANYENSRPEVQVKVVKKSENDDATLPGAVFGLYAGEDITGQDGTVLVKEGTLIETVTSDNDGNAQFQADIPIGFQYYVEEIQAPNLYYMSSEVYEFSYGYQNDTTYTYTFEHTFSNKEVRGEVHVSKIDVDSQKFISQGDASLDGAVYGLYAAEDINYPNGKTGLVHRKDELVAQGTVKDGKIDFTNLYLGNYYVKEISPGEGYLLDETAYPVEVSYEGQEVAIVNRYVTVKETVKKQAFELIKISEDGEQTETDLVEGAGFKIFRISQLSGVKDGTLKPSNGSSFTPEDFIGYDYSKDQTASYYENGKEIFVDELFTDEKGYLCSPELPYGTYVVFESTTPESLQTIRPFLITIQEDSRDPQPWRIFDDRPILFYFKIIKEDAQTNLPVLNNSSKYKIYDVENEEYVSMKVRYPEIKTVDVFETNEEGYLQTPEQLKMGTYRIEEIEAPDLYIAPGFEFSLINDGESIPLNQVVNGGEYQEAGREVITITVDSNTAYEVEEDTGKYVVVVHQENDSAVGSLTLKKQGEFLTGAEKVEDALLEKVKNGFAGLINKVRELFGQEEILETSSGYIFQYEEGPAAGAEFAVYANDTIYTPDGQVDENGNRIVRYEKDALVSELVTGEDGTAVLNNLPVGKYYVKETKPAAGCVLDTETREFEIQYQGQEVAVDYVTMEWENARQTVELEILKLAKGLKKPVEGATFALYAEEDILNVSGEVVVPKDTLIAETKSDEKGIITFNVDLPHGKFYVKELEPAPGYLPNEETYYFDASYTDPELETISLEAEIENQPTIVKISKTDITGGEEVEGAKLQILTEDGNVVEEWISTKDPHTVYALAPGNYVLHEEEAPTENGYVRAEDVPFTVELTGDVQQVSMKDDHTKVEISKTDITDEAEVEGATLQVLDKDGNVVEEWISGKEPHLIEKLPVGDYVLHEEAAPNGYLVVSDVPFTVEETGEIQKVSMEDERPVGQLIVKKTDSENGVALAGVEFEIRNKVTGEVVGTIVTGNDGIAKSEALPIAVYEDGKYVEPIVYSLVETKPLDGYESNSEEYEVVFNYKDDQTSVIEVTKEIQNTRKPGTPAPTAPKTGDTTNIWIPIVVALIALAGIVIEVVRMRRKRK